MAEFRVTAAGLLRDYEGRVLLVRSPQGWVLPGADADAGETPLDAAERGLAESVGVNRRPGSLLVADATAGALAFLFDAGRLDDVSEARPETGARFADVSELDGLVPTEVARRIATAVSETGQVYAEDGLNPAEGWGFPVAEDS